MLRKADMLRFRRLVPNPGERVERLTILCGLSPLVRKRSRVQSSPAAASIHLNYWRFSSLNRFARRCERPKDLLAPSEAAVL